MLLSTDGMCSPDSLVRQTPQQLEPTDWREKPERSERNEITLWVEDLVEASRRLIGDDHRHANRNPLVCAVEVESRVWDWSTSAFSRDISVDGIGLISADPIPDRLTADLCVQRFDGTVMKVVASCRWCKAYGENWFASGWAFRELIGVRRY